MGQLSANKKGADILVYPIMKGFYLMSYFVSEDNNLILFPLVWQTSKTLMLLTITIVFRANHCLDISFRF